MTLWGGLVEVAAYTASETVKTLPITGAGKLSSQIKVLAFGISAVETEAEAIFNDEDAEVAIGAFLIAVAAVAVLPEAAVVAGASSLAAAAYTRLGGAISQTVLEKMITGVAQAGIGSVIESAVKPVIELMIDVGVSVQPQPASVNDLLSSNDPVDAIYGTASGDVRTGTSGNDAILTLEDDDDINGTAGNDGLYGGDGEDRADYSAFTTGLRVDARLGQVFKENGIDILSSIEEVKLSLANDLVIGSLNGTTYTDPTMGGTDTIDYSSYEQALEIDLAGLVELRTGGSGEHDNISGFENAIGTAAADIIDGTSVANILTGGRGADTMYGYDGQDTYVWNVRDGQDVIYDDWSDGDILAFGPGISASMVSLSTSGADLQVIVRTGVTTNSSLPDYQSFITIKNQASLFGTFLSNHVTGLVPETSTYNPTTTNTITGTPSSETLNGTSANDRIQGQGGTDTINGLDGDDRLEGSGINTTMNGGDGNDYLSGGVGFANGGAGNDWLSGAKIMHGNTGDDVIWGNVSTTEIYGDDGGDTIWAYTTSPNLVIYGGDGDDVIETESAGHAIFGDAGNDVITVKTFTSGNDVSVDGGDGDDVIHLGENDGTAVTVGEGNDVVYKMAGYQTEIVFAEGVSYTHSERVGTSNDLVIYFDNGASVRLSDYYSQQSEWVLPALTLSTTFMGGGSSEAAYGISSLHDVMYGNGGDDELHAGDGDDTVYGGDGNDILYGDAGDDIIEGDDGDDEIHSESGDDLIKGGAGTDELFLGSGVDSGDVTFQRDGNNLLIQVNDGRTVTLVGQYINNGSSYTQAVETFDGTNLLTAMLGVNNIPQAQADAFSGNEDSNITGNLLSDNGSGADSDPDSDPLTATAGTFATAHGSVTISSNGNFTYTPTSNYNGTDSFEYEANDGEGGDDTAVVNLTINAVNDAFSVNNGGASFDQDTTFTFTTAQLSATDVDNTDDQLVFELTSAPAHGTLKLGATALGVNDSFTKQDIIDGLVKFYPATGYIGADSFDFTVSDGTYTWPSSLTFNLSINPISLNLNGTSGNDTLTGGAGDDIISGFGGDDTLYGMAGDDLISGGTGSDWIEGGDDDDVIYTNGGAIDYAFGGAGNDIIYNYGPVTSQADLVSSYSLTSAQLSDYDGLFGGDGDDIIYAQYNNANLYGEGGNDQLFGSSGNNNYIASDGYDIVDDEGHMNYGAGVGGTDKIYLTTASGYTYSTLKFTTLNNHQDLYIWMSATAATTIIGQFSGDANKVIEQVYQQATATHYTISSLSTFDILGGSGNDTLNGFDSLTFGDDTIRGNAGADTINGKGGMDWLYGGAGNDTLTGGAGNDLLYGEADSDTYVFNLGDGQDTVTDTGGTADKILLGSGISLSDIVLTDVSTYDLEMTFTNTPTDKITMANFRNGSSNKIETISFNGSDVSLIYGTASSETLTGTSGVDLIYGKGGSNSINTGNGNDIIIGGNDYDDINYTLYSYTGNKTIYGNGGNDRIATGSGSDTVYGGDGSDNVNGLQGDDTLYGGNDIDYLSGHGGNDVIYGESGDDWVMGWIGNDILYGGDGNDEVIASHPGGYSTMASVFGAHTGTNNAKTLYGEAGVDNLYGYIGDDILVGGTGADTLSGDAGADEFVFNAGDLGTGVDTITDFSKTSGDAINVADLIEGFYDPMQHAINDFVSLSVSGGNTTIAVDRDGTGSTYAAQNVVVVNSQTWSNVADMLSGGDLIVQD